MDAGSRRPAGSTSRAAAARGAAPAAAMTPREGPDDDEETFSAAPIAEPKPPPATWDEIRNWDAAPAQPPPPARPPAKRVGGGAKQVAPPGADGCADPGCADPLCAPLERRAGSGPRSGDMTPAQMRLQESLLGLAKDNKATEIRALIAAHGLSAAYGNSIGQSKRTR